MKEKDYINSYIKHMIDMVEYGNSVSYDIVQITKKYLDMCRSILDKYKICLTLKKMKQIKKELNDLLKSYEDEINVYFNETVTDIIESEKSWLTEIVEKYFNIKFDFKDNFYKMLLLIPIANIGSLKEYAEKLSGKVKNIFNSQINQSYVTGTDFEDIKNGYEQMTNSFENSIKSDCETVGSTLYNQYERIVFTNNNTQVEYVWVAVLDSRTCIVCGLLDGTRYKNLSDVPVYPQHNRCRCSVIPVNDSILKNMPESYSQWFEERSDDEKYKILGRERFKLYENGMKIKAFVNNGKKTPLKDLNMKKKQ